ncbi:MAG TPA: transporter [Longimicrobium sp.]|nr:transporter [Longimicrobium sp.]
MPTLPRALRFLFLATLAAPAAARAQAEAPKPIQDNSFLVEEAYNQEPGVVQHIGTWERPTDGGAWAFGFTQEWPLGSLRHQLSYTLPVDHAAGETTLGQVMLNYRYQWIGSGDARVAVSPRLSAILPTGPEEAQGDRWGAQANLPVSVQLAPRWVAHTNLGATWLPRDGSVMEGSAEVNLDFGQSVIWLLHPRVNLLLELAGSTEEDDGGDAFNARLSPGVRFALDGPGGVQVVPGIALPIGIGPSNGQRELFLYLSLEHAFTRAAR